jgi:hypothetical protein
MIVLSLLLSVAWTIVTLQQHLPLNPDGIASMEPTLAVNTISSFTTNIYAAGGGALPRVGSKAIDVLLAAVGLA